MFDGQQQTIFLLRGKIHSYPPPPHDMISPRDEFCTPLLLLVGCRFTVRSVSDNSIPLHEL